MPSVQRLLQRISSAEKSNQKEISSDLRIIQLEQIERCEN